MSLLLLLDQELTAGEVFTDTATVVQARSDSSPLVDARSDTSTLVQARSDSSPLVDARSDTSTLVQARSDVVER
jgi:hypothetical protein